MKGWQLEFWNMAFYSEVLMANCIGIRKHRIVVLLVDDENMQGLVPSAVLHEKRQRWWRNRFNTVSTIQIHQERLRFQKPFNNIEDLLMGLHM